MEETLEQTALETNGPNKRRAEARPLAGDTARRVAERQAARPAEVWRETAAELTAACDALDVALFVIDAGGQIVRLNVAAAELAAGGPHANNAAPLTLADLGPGQPWQGASELVESLWNLPAEPVRKSQMTDQATGRTWELTAQFFAVEERQRALLTIREMTEAVALHDARLRRELTSAMESLWVNVAHEVRNPLFSLTAILDAFEAEPPNGEQETQEYLAALRRQVDRLSKLMQEILVYGKPLSLELATAAVEALVAQTVVDCAALAKTAGVEVQCGIDPECGMALVDRLRLMQVLHNVIENAIQHSRPGGVVTVRANHVLRRRQAWVKFEVEDAGPGFAAETLPRVFEPFFTRRKGGIGLGLAIAQRIVEQHGGLIAARNSERGGAVVVFEIPAQ